MFKRVMVAVVGLPLLILILGWAPSWATMLLLAAMCAIGAWELMRAAAGERGKPLTPLTVIAAAAVPVEAAVPVVSTAGPDVKLTKVVVITRQSKFEELKAALEQIGITGLTVTQVLGCGMQKGRREYYRGAEVETTLLPKVKLEVVISKVPLDLLIATVRRALYTGAVGDGKIFVYDVENVVKVRTGEEGYAALQDED